MITNACLSQLARAALSVLFVIPRLLIDPSEQAPPDGAVYQRVRKRELSCPGTRDIAHACGLCHLSKPPFETGARSGSGARGRQAPGRPLGTGSRIGSCAPRKKKL